MRGTKTVDAAAVPRALCDCVAWAALERAEDLAAAFQPKDEQPVLARREELGIAARDQAEHGLQGAVGPPTRPLLWSCWGVRKKQSGPEGLYRALGGRCVAHAQWGVPVAASLGSFAFLLSGFPLLGPGRRVLTVAGCGQWQRTPRCMEIDGKRPRMLEEKTFVAFGLGGVSGLGDEVRDSQRRSAWSDAPQRRVPRLPRPSRR